jgi:hypothetical protein
MKEYKIGGTCSKNAEDEKCYPENVKGRPNSEDLVGSGRIILKNSCVVV